jgi:tryptophanyl-tRNA synthetase
MRQRVLSAMRPTGRLHLGHYFGALKNWLQLQKECDCLYMSADLHALTTEYIDTSKIEINSFEMLADWLAVGISPEKSVIFKQSAVKQHSELFLILAMITPLGWLERCPTYKEQIKEIKNKDLSNYGFLGYPVLMAADILLYRSTLVPVGEDQLSHLEFSREIVRRFNNFYGEIFVEPKEKLTKDAKVPGIDGRKMSKSYGNSIFIGEEPDAIKEKVKQMFTDPAKIKKDDPGHPDGCVVFAFYKIFNTDCLDKENECKAGSIGCSVCKKQVSEILIEFMRPLSEKRKSLVSDKGYLQKILEIGNEKASNIAEETMKKIREGLKF